MASTEIRKRIAQSAKLVVVKIGTNVLTGKDGRLDRRLIARLARQIAQHHSQGRRFVVVTSGAIGSGMGEIGMTVRPKAVNELQALAAIGQKQLMAMFHAAFSRHHLHAAQILVTRDDYEKRERYLNIRNTINTLHRMNAIPVINENDCTAVDEIRFGDNDIIAAQTANLLRADLMVILSVVDGLLDAQGQRIDLVDQVNDSVTRLARRTKSSLGSGGMASKLMAISMVSEAGEVAMIANGRAPNVIAHILAGDRVGTVFLPAPRKMPSKQRWIGMAVRPVGAIRVDGGAVSALVSNGKSLLPGGIIDVCGQFAAGDVVAVLGPDGMEIARGQSHYSSEEVERIKGCRTSQIAQRLRRPGRSKLPDEVIHRDSLVVLAR